MQLRVGDPRMLTRMRRWLKAGVLRPDGAMEAVECGTLQGGSISVLLSNVYLHYAEARSWKQHPQAHGDAVKVISQNPPDAIGRLLVECRTLELATG